MNLIRRPVRAVCVAALGLATLAMAGALGSAAVAAPSQASPFTIIKDSLPATTDKPAGTYTSSSMSIEVALSPRDEAALNSQLSAVYNPASREYHHWLAKGRFDSLYAPSGAERAAVTSYLHSAGLSVGASGSPFLIRASGSSRQIEAAFRTTLSDYVDPKGIRYFSNSAPVQLPATLASGVLGVIGLTNTARERPMLTPSSTLGRLGAKSAGSSQNCESPYPTPAEAFDFFVNGSPISYGYGGAPGCNGLTPSQTNSTYGAPNAGPAGKGSGVSVAVFELSAYQHSDIDTWAHTFYGPGYSPPLVDINVDGGPLHPVCPAGDTCPPDINYYAGDDEVDTDIEMSLAIAPDVSNVLVYNAPNDYTGQTSLDEYTKIADDDAASTVSSSWGVCENDLTAGYVQTENVIFEQMALQGQSMFGSAGDTGAFGCIRSDGTTIVNVTDPAAQPWVTSVGGTSFESDNPGANPLPAYPQGVETVWNSLTLCNSQGPDAGNDYQGGFFWCAVTGAGGGGSSQWWGRPLYQYGPGVTNPYTTYGNGTTQCALAVIGTPCREMPDISADADIFTGYGVYCTGNASTPYSVCATLTSDRTPPGWIYASGTSASSPLWAAIFADRDSYTKQRTGNANPLLYLLYNLDPSRYFNDIGSFSNGPLTPATNGLFPTVPGYDLATGIGTPKMAAIITGS
jgi:subtilase family serine protease